MHHSAAKDQLLAKLGEKAVAEAVADQHYNSKMLPLVALLPLLMPSAQLPAPYVQEHRTWNPFYAALHPSDSWSPYVLSEAAPEFVN
jgi:hypothetical protein